ncbi:MAG: ABC transporter ATP-binding protein [Alphaproteobacteria bacterium]
MFREPSVTESLSPSTAKSSSGSPQRKAEGKKRANIKPLLLLWPLLTPSLIYLRAGIIALVAASLSVLGLGRGLSVIIDKAFLPGNSDYLDKALGYMLLGVLVLSVSSFARLYLFNRAAETLGQSLKNQLFERLVRYRITFYETHNAGELTTRINTHLSVIQMVCSTAMPIALRNIVLAVGGLLLMMSASASLSLITIAMVPVVVGLLIVAGRQIGKLNRKAQEYINLANAHMSESLSNIATIKSFTQENYASQKQYGLQRSNLLATLRYILARSSMAAFVITLVFASVGGVLWMGGHEVLQGHITGGELSAFVFNAILVASAVGALSEVHGDLSKAAFAVEDLFNLIAQDDMLENDTGIEAPEVLHNSRLISFHSVGFSYPSRPEQMAANNLSFTIRHGEKVALVGPSGAGKSTIFQLLLRFYDYQSGKILYGESEITKLSLSALRRCFALVPQDPVIFSGSVRDNIAFGRNNVSDEMVIEAAKAAYAFDFIQHLPQGLDTVLGERGLRLSGGQKQRIAIARAFLADAPILLLDEATSALDAESEQAVYAALDHLMTHQKTTLIIAHRLSTIQKADRILYLSHGGVLEQGTHQELLQHNGEYARMVQLNNMGLK